MFDIAIIQMAKKEATYINTDKTQVYRPIIKYCYTSYLQANRVVYAHEVLEFLKSTGGFTAYT
ncbi:TIGR02677 family protein, partial [Bacillus cereus]|nr:TIGR02677 family protein [Bacillus cereus]